MLIAIGVLAYWSATRMRDDAVWVAHKQNVFRVLLSVVFACTELLASEREYILTGNALYLRAYDENVGSAAAALRQVRGLTEDNPAQRRRLTVISALVSRLEDYSSRIVRVRHDQGAQRAIELALSGMGERLLGAIGANVSEMLSAEHSQLTERQRRMTHAREVTLYLILAGSGLAVLVVLIASMRIQRDLHTLQRAEERFRALMDSTPDAMLVVGRRGNIVLANAHTEVMFGYNRTELVGEPIETLIPERYRVDHEAHRNTYVQAAVLRSMGANLELFARNRDGSEIPVEVSLSPVTTTSGLQVICAIRDISDRKRTLEHLRSTRAVAENAARVKSTFLATASHDLRQPLQTISLLNGALRRIYKDTYATDALLQQEAAISVMSRLLSALLDISKLESGAVTPQIADWQIVTLFDQMRGEFAKVAVESGLQLEIEHSPLWVRSDLSLVGQVLRNLLSNAIKYTRHGRVRLRALLEVGEVCVEVSDTGIGMAQDELSHIYEEFYQIGVPTNATREGYGLGLTIVSRIVKLLNLKLDVHSEIGKGSMFALTLPVGTATPESVNRSGVIPLIERTDRGVHHILVVDDEPAVLDATRLLLMSEGYRVATAASISQAIAHVNVSRDLELVITDYHLAEGETGKLVIESLRGLRGPNFQAILITGDTSTAMRGIEGDANLHYLSKPVNADELLRLLTELLESRPPAQENT